MNFDATVTIGTVLQIGGAVFMVLSFIIIAIGTKLWVGKGDLAQIRTDFNADVGRVSNAVTLGIDATNKAMLAGLEAISQQAKERHERACEDFDRISVQVTEALAEAKAANVNAITAFQAAQRADINAEHAVKHADDSAKRQDRAIEGLQNRRREGDR